VILLACILIPQLAQAQAWNRPWERPMGPPPEYESPPPCPKCGSCSTIGIAYGYPSPELSQAAKDGRVQLGGCEISLGSKKWRCKKCGYAWG
jgi:hypothetical protein